MNIYEMYGRQAEQAAQLRAFYDGTMKLLRDLETGVIPPSQILVTDNGWELRDLPVSNPNVVERFETNGVKAEA